MEWLVLGLAAVAAWFFFFPRAPRSTGWVMVMKPAVLGAVVLAGWLAISALSGPPRPTGDGVLDASVPPERRTDQTMDYAAGDEALRAILLSQ